MRGCPFHSGLSEVHSIVPRALPALRPSSSPCAESMRTVVLVGVWNTQRSAEPNRPPIKPKFSSCARTTTFSASAAPHFPFTSTSACGRVPVVDKSKSDQSFFHQSPSKAFKKDVLTGYPSVELSRMAYASFNRRPPSISPQSPARLRRRRLKLFFSVEKSKSPVNVASVLSGRTREGLMPFHPNFENANEPCPRTCPALLHKSSVPKTSIAPLRSTPIFLVLSATGTMRTKSLAARCA